MEVDVKAWVEKKIGYMEKKEKGKTERDEEEKV